MYMRCTVPLLFCGCSWPSSIVLGIRAIFQANLVVYKSPLPFNVEYRRSPARPITTMSLGLSRLSSILLLAVYASAYTWPSPQLDELESLLYDQHGFNERGILAGALSPCNTFGFGNIVNRSNAADWIRTVRNASSHILHAPRQRLTWSEDRLTTIWPPTTWKTALVASMPRSSSSKTGLR